MLWDQELWEGREVGPPASEEWTALRFEWKRLAQDSRALPEFDSHRHPLLCRRWDDSIASDPKMSSATQWAGMRASPLENCLADRPGDARRAGLELR